MRTRLTPFALAFALLAPYAHADDAAQADALLARGVELRRERKDAEALEEFRHAYAVHPAPRALAQIGLAEEALGLWVEAEQALHESLDAKNDAWIDKHRPQLLETLHEIEPHLADVEIAVAPASAEVWINGARAEPRPGTRVFRVVSGRVLLEARAPGFAEDRRTRTVPPGAHVTERFDLAVMHAESAPTPTAPAPAPAAPARGSSVRRTIAWSALGVSGAFLATGIAFAVKRQVELNRYDGDSCNYGGVPRQVRCPDVVSDYDSASRWSLISFGAAAATGVFSAALLLLTPADTPRPVVGLGVSKDGAQLFFRKEL